MPCVACVSVEHVCRVSVWSVCVLAMCVVEHVCAMCVSVEHVCVMCVVCQCGTCVCHVCHVCHVCRVSVWSMCVPCVSCVSVELVLVAGLGHACTIESEFSSTTYMMDFFDRSVPPSDDM